MSADTINFDVPAYYSEPGSNGAKILEDIFCSVLANATPTGTGVVIDSSATVNACIDAVSFILAHGSASRSPTKAREAAQGIAKDIQTRLLRYRREMNDGVIQSPFSAPPRKPS